MTWTALLARWMDFARASLVLPPDATGERWRASVTPVITLQAVTFALAELGRLVAEDRPLARDRVEVLIDRSAGDLADIWRDAAMSETLREIIEDARAALAASARTGA